MSDIFKNTKWKAYNFSECVPKISITENGITFNKGCLQKLENPEYVSILFNYDDKQMALVKSCKEQKSDYRVGFYKKGLAREMTCVRLNQENLIKQVEYMMNWELRKDAFRCDGVYIESDKAIIFSLSEAKRM